MKRPIRTSNRLHFRRTPFGIHTCILVAVPVFVQKLENSFLRQLLLQQNTHNYCQQQIETSQLGANLENQHFVIFQSMSKACKQPLCSPIYAAYYHWQLCVIITCGESPELPVVILQNTLWIGDEKSRQKDWQLKHVPSEMNATTFSHFPNLAIAAEGVELITSDESPLR